MQNGATITVMEVMKPEDYVVDSDLMSKYTIKHTEGSDWHCYLLGDEDDMMNAIVWRPAKGKEPNRFHRWMQELCFGIKWRKLK